MLVSRSMAVKRQLMKVINRWPVALILIGIALTLVWMAALILYPLHMLGVV
jgi:hypothetical protein